MRNASVSVFPLIASNINSRGALLRLCLYMMPSFSEQALLSFVAISFMDSRMFACICGKHNIDFLSNPFGNGKRQFSHMQTHRHTHTHRHSERNGLRFICTDCCDIVALSDERASINTFQIYWQTRIVSIRRIDCGRTSPTNRQFRTSKSRTKNDNRDGRDREREMEKWHFVSGSFVLAVMSMGER